MNASQPIIRRASGIVLAGTVLTLVGLLLWTPAPARTVAGADREPTAAASGADGLAVPAASPTRRALEHAPGYYGAPVGTAIAHDLHGHYEYALAHPEGGSQRSGMKVDGSFEVMVAARSDDALVVRVACQGLALSALAGGGGSDERGFGKAAQRPFDVRLGFDGKVLGYRFADDLDAEQRNFLRGLFASYAHTVPIDAQGSWEAEEQDGAGVVLARFTLARQDDDVVRVERRKLRYTRMAGPELHPHRLTGGSQATFSRALGWSTEVQVDERQHLDMTELGLAIDLHSVLSFVSTGHREVAPPADVDAAEAADWEPATGCGENLAAAGEARDRARWSKMLEGKTLAGLIDELAALLAAKPRDAEAVDRAWQAVIWQVRLDPKVAAELRVRVGAGMETELADLLVSALGAAGTEPAQVVLADMRHDGSLPAAVRTSATISMFQLAHPNQRVLTDVVRDLGAAGDLVGDDAMAMLLLGALAPRAEGIDVNGTTATAALLAFEAKAERQGRLDLWLNALGNAGGDAVLQSATRLTGHQDDVVRAAAYNALRKVDAPAAVAVLERGLTDASASVRADAVNALGEHRSTAACAALVRTARDDADASVRRACLQGLSTFAKPGSPALHAIETMAASDPDRDNREAAKGILQGMQR